MSWVAIATGVLGGLGLFLLGMRMLSEGLRVAAGRALRRILERSAATRLRGVLSGVLITSLVQSSSAVTVAVIGFANAGLLTLGQSIAVIYGSNVGTTATGWLVALIGFHMDVKALALPGIGVGMALRLAAGGQRLGALGEALAGFGLFFLGIDVLKSALVGLDEALPIEHLAVGGVGAVVLLSGVGALLTVLMQSSSAAIAIILTSVGGGVLPIEAGACLVIGANIGTTSTAAIAVIGATSNAKRVALAHVAFNGITGVVALATLPLLLVGVGRFREVLGLETSPAAVVAGFHTVFNLLGVALMWPLTNSLVALLERRFVTREEQEGQARYLDRNVLSTPFLAASALGLELARIGSIAREMALQSLRRSAGPAQLARRREALGQLLAATGGFVTELQRQRLPKELGSALPTALRVGRYYAEAAELAESIAASETELEPLPADFAARVTGFEESALRFLDLVAVEVEGTDAEAASRGLAEVERAYHELKDALLRAGAEGRVPVAALVAQLDRLSNLRRMLQQLERGARYLWALGALAAGDAQVPELPEPGSPDPRPESQQAQGSSVPPGANEVRPAQGG